MTQDIRRILVIIDLQKRFINDSTRHLPERVEKFILARHDRYDLIIGTLFRNSEGSQFAKSLDWHKMEAGTPETAFVSRIEGLGVVREVEKGACYDASESILHLLKSSFEWCGVTAETVFEFDLCGLDTEACVYATAMGLFDSEHRVRVLYPLCASSGGEDIHRSMLPIMERTFRKENIIMNIDDIFDSKYNDEIKVGDEIVAKEDSGVLTVEGVVREITEDGDGLSYLVQNPNNRNAEGTFVSTATGDDWTVVRKERYDRERAIVLKAARTLAESAVRELGQDEGVIPYLTERNIPRAQALYDAGLLRGTQGDDETSKLAQVRKVCEEKTEYGLGAVLEVKRKLLAILEQD